jgi:cryptochrome
MFWREFFYTVSNATPNFDKMEGNPLCKQVSLLHTPPLIL